MAGDDARYSRLHRCLAACWLDPNMSETSAAATTIASNFTAPANDAPVVLSERHGGVLTLTLNRPTALNSFNAQLHTELMAAITAAASDATVRCLVLTGAGRGFCAGQDLSDAALGLAGGQLQATAAGSAPGDIGDLIEARYKPLALALRDFPAPTVAAVNGVAAGAGANLALHCDIVLATRSASFIQAFSKIALIPDCGGTWLLPRLVGRARATALCLLGDKLSAEEAERIGLIWRCVDDGSLVEQSLALAQRLAGLPTKALVETRLALHASSGIGLADALSLEAQVQRRLGAAPDFAEGVQAFFAKRAPQFSDR